MSAWSALKRIALALFLLSALIVGGAAYWGWTHYTSFASAPLPGVEEGDSLVVERGDSLRRVVTRLRGQGNSAGSDIEWRLLARQLGAGDRIQVGEYALEPGITPSQLLLRMRDGKVVHHRVTIVEGWNIRELRAALARATPLVQTLHELDDAALMAALGREGVHPEGRFLPETYAYTTGDTDLDLLRRAAADLDSALDAAWDARADNLPISSKDEALVLASIVEKETGIAEERARIAGVFTRRLRIGMRLQTDPTVIYGMGSSYAGNIRRADLLADTPYNTYTRDGLPPTPIAMAGRDALRAATQPAEGDDLYFVAVGDGSGRHVFSPSLDAHNTAVREYVRRYRQQHAPR
ncbi:endolytic transglycosylase MltG [Luteimonas sp. MC1572]|uniref:endolytic transglycosylase MltG n=1 Tax=Luteimonas sp. MC1572 TaxID=2799325 RepID=UPI0018F0711B|nr:endolytic transglycosylase MltG [Luteimonas sp. MC1572]MBJ6981058.1 endolytic transglycosylase MltG [Luteimonas sp. MC1572]QQO02398.1 endolytic transglycosylase MltG [Luteimonas sp. MC1572]